MNIANKILDFIIQELPDPAYDMLIAKGSDSSIDSLIIDFTPIYRLIRQECEQVPNSGTYEARALIPKSEAADFIDTMLFLKDLAR